MPGDFFSEKPASAILSTMEKKEQQGRQGTGPQFFFEPGNGKMQVILVRPLGKTKLPGIFMGPVFLPQFP
jgi:hypothetical protein